MILLSAYDAIKTIKSGSSLFIQGGASIPHALVNALTERASELKDVNVYSSFAVDRAILPYSQKEYLASFKAFTFFVSSNIRAAIREGFAQTIPACLSEIPFLFQSRCVPIDVVFYVYLNRMKMVIALMVYQVILLVQLLIVLILLLPRLIIRCRTHLGMRLFTFLKLTTPFCVMNH